MLIYFAKVKTFVPMEVILIYLYWLVRRSFFSRSVRGFLIGVWKPTWLRESPGYVLETLAVARSLGLENGWVRWDTDGSRRQVFSPWKGVCKMSKPGAVFEIRDEVALRKELGDLSPRILECNLEQNAYIEEWIEASPGRGSVEELAVIRQRLVSRLYQVRELDLSSYLNAGTISFSDEARRLIPVLVQCLERTTLPVSNVHGDLVCANIGYRSNGKPVLYDWEYSRSCVVTHDVWFFLYHQYVTDSRRLELADFLHRLNRAIAWAFPTIPDIRALHLIHLFEREALMIRNSEIVDSYHSLKILRSSIDPLIDHFLTE